MQFWRKFSRCQISREKVTSRFSAKLLKKDNLLDSRVKSKNLILTKKNYFYQIDPWPCGQLDFFVFIFEYFLRSEITREAKIVDEAMTSRGNIYRLSIVDDLTVNLILVKENKNDSFLSKMETISLFIIVDFADCSFFLVHSLRNLWWIPKLYNEINRSVSHFSFSDIRCER